MTPSQPIDTAESPLGCDVHRASRGPTCDEYDFTNSRQRELEPPSPEAAGVAAVVLVELPAALAVVETRFQNFTTPSALPVMTYPCRNDVQQWVTVDRCIYET